MSKNKHGQPDDSADAAAVSDPPAADLPTGETPASHGNETVGGGTSLRHGKDVTLVTRREVKLGGKLVPAGTRVAEVMLGDGVSLNWLVDATRGGLVGVKKPAV